MPEEIEFNPHLITDLIWEEYPEWGDEAEELLKSIIECDSWKECLDMLNKKGLHHYAETIEDWLEDSITQIENEKKEQEIIAREEAKKQAIENDAKRTTQIELF